MHREGDEDFPEGVEEEFPLEVEDAEGGQTYSLTHEWCRLHTRSAHAVTISSCQGRQFAGSLALWDTRHPRFSKRHLYTALSRARSWEALAIEE